MMILAELGLGETVAASALSALFTAIAVTMGAGLVVRYFEAKTTSRRQADDAQAAENRRRADEALAERLQSRELEHQTRAALRETYYQLLVAQRRSREASIKLAAADGVTAGEGLRGEVSGAHDEFINQYHRLNLDATPEMWRDARGLRKVLDDMRDFALSGDSEACQGLAETARRARQNLERSLRIRLGYPTLQERKEIGTYDRGDAS
jgi:hypothetical protein